MHLHQIGFNWIPGHGGKSQKEQVPKFWIPWRRHDRRSAEDTLKAVQNLSKRESRLRFLREMERDLEAVGVLANNIWRPDGSSVQSCSGSKMFKDDQTRHDYTRYTDGYSMD